MKRHTIALAALALAATACTSGSEPPPQPSQSLSVGRPSSTAKIAIVSPKPGDTVRTTGVTVKISLEGARIVEQVSTNLKPDEGHMHLNVDARTITLTGDLEEPTGPLSAGAHLIQIEFVAVDHGPFNPRVIAQVNVTAA